MVSRQVLDEYGAANNGIVAMAQKDLVDFWKLLDVTKPLEVKAAMLEFMPELISSYGESAALLAADFYDAARPAGLDPYVADVANVPDVDQVAAVTRNGIGPLFQAEPDGAAALSKLASATQRLVNQPARETIAKNADLDGASWARVPMGRTTCSFCRMLASRGAAYGSKASASAKRNGSKYHDDCDCKPVPIWSSADYPEGYDPDELYDEYAAAHEPGMSTKETLAAMRKQDGEFVTAITEVSAPSVPVSRVKEIEDATSVSDVGSALQALIGDRGKVSGFDAPKLDLARAKETAVTLGRLFEKYPNVSSNISVTKIANSKVLAQAGSRTGKVEDLVMEISEAKLKATSKLANQFDLMCSSGHVHVHDRKAVDPMQYTVTHEFGHLIDGTIKPFHFDAVKDEIMAENGWRKHSKEQAAYFRANQSVYGRSNKAEGIAEAFADVEINGAKAFEFSKRVHAAMIARLADAGS